MQVTPPSLTLESLPLRVTFADLELGSLQAQSRGDRRKLDKNMTELGAFLKYSFDFNAAVGLWTSGLNSSLWIKSAQLQCNTQKTVAMLLPFCRKELLQRN